MPSEGSQLDANMTVPGTPAVLGLPPALTVVNPDGSSDACRMVGVDCKVIHHALSSIAAAYSLTLLDNIL